MNYLEQLVLNCMSEAKETAVKKDPIVNDVFARTSNDNQCINDTHEIINDYIETARIG